MAHPYDEIITADETMEDGAEEAIDNSIWDELMESDTRSALIMREQLAFTDSLMRGGATAEECDAIIHHIYEKGTAYRTAEDAIEIYRSFQEGSKSEYDHSLNSVRKACGMTKDELHEAEKLRCKVCEKFMGVERHSEMIEALVGVLGVTKVQATAIDGFMTCPALPEKMKKMAASGPLGGLAAMIVKLG